MAKCPLGQRLESLITGTKGAFAKRIGISHTQLSNTLSGRTPPSRLLLKRLAAVLLVREEWLENGELPMRGTPTTSTDEAMARALVGLRIADGTRRAVQGALEQFDGWEEVHRVRLRDLEVIIRQRRDSKSEGQTAETVEASKEDEGAYTPS